jgi:hypothetical protein
VEGDPDPIIEGGKAKHFLASKVQVIMYLSRNLSPAEKNY